MVIYKLDDTLKKALQSLIIVPAWDYVKSGTDCKVSSSTSTKTKNKKPSMTTSTSVSPSQKEKLYLLYHGADFLKKCDSAQLSHVTQFVNMMEPFKEFVGCFATVENDSTITTVQEDGTKNSIHLDISEICHRPGELLALGRDGREVCLQLHMKSLNYAKVKGNSNPPQLTSSDTLYRTAKKPESGVQKLLSYDHQFRNDDGSLPSGIGKDDLLNGVLQKSWREEKWVK